VSDESHISTREAIPLNAVTVAVIPGRRAVAETFFHYMVELPGVGLSDYCFDPLNVGRERDS
jgi:hypothetical protein